ncbi:thermonuclease family protein [Geomonas sp. RF6]|uniref:thermonuclease family protein n=1 Tax=Geomonas sp. RF6 TaxID=2897342 RepID=UPI001E52FCF7|nr:thermonuclease family protein [Geomonas sp. RF6]UFS69480.1 thermonuclease family protein [Geomonas sp. RF6]
MQFRTPPPTASHSFLSSWFVTFLVPLLLVFPNSSLAKNPIRSIQGTVSKVTDGDSITVNDILGTKVKVRLYGIDAPETEKSNTKTGKVSSPGQPYANQAWEALGNKVYHQAVRLDVMSIDRYKRLVCLVWIGSRSINREMVAEGWAWAYREYLGGAYSSEYVSAEDRARNNKLGLWQQYNPQPPWEFRKYVRMKRSL